MNSTDAIKLLDECEKGLRRLMGSAAADGDYVSVMKLTSWARVVGGLADDAKMERSSAGSDSLKEIERPSRVSARSVGGPESRSPKSDKPRLGKLSGYPKFFRTSKELIKIGWSKRERAEYHHKAPYPVLMQLISRLTMIGAGGAIFAAESILPLEAEDGAAIPNYQVYLCLAWLRHESLIAAHGRQGYSVLDGNLAAAVSSRWNALEAWRR